MLKELNTFINNNIAVIMLGMLMVYPMYMMMYSEIFKRELMQKDKK